MEIIKLNLIPTGVNPTCHCSQYDEGRVIRIELFDGLTPYTLQSGDTVTLNVRKPDNTIVTTTVETTQGNNYVDIVTTEQICACVGYNLCDLTITNGSVVIGTLNFIMAIERDVLADGIESQSVIKDLDTLVQAAISENIYNVMPIETAQGNIVTFTDGADNIPVKSLVSQIVATGGGGTPDAPIAINGFDSGNLYNYAKYHRIIASALTPQTQNGITVTPFADGRFEISGTATSNTTFYFETPLFTIFGDDTRTVNFNNNFVNSSIVVGFIKDSTVIDSWGMNILNRSHTNYTAMSNKECNVLYVTISSGVSISGSFKVEFLVTNSGTAYNFSFGQTVYGGHFDNKGNLVVTHIYRLFDGFDSQGWAYQRAYGTSLRFNYTNSDIKPNSTSLISNMFEYSAVLPDIEGISTHSSSNMIVLEISSSRLGGSTVADLMTFFANNNLQVVYELANPIVLPITSQDIPTALGENNFYSDTGDVDVTIRADIGLYIDKRLNANRSTPNNLSRAAAYVDDPESVNESQEDNVETQNEDR